MALANSGFDGTVNEAEYANAWGLGGTDSVESLAAWAVTQGTGRQVSVAAAAGRAFAKGVLSKDGSSAITKNLSTPAAGQWFLITRRIDWATNTITIEALAHSTTTTAIPTAPPTGLPTMEVTPGTKWDQKLAWAWVRNTDTTMVLFDLRSLPLSERTVATQAALPAANTVRRDYAYYVEAIPGATFFSNGTAWRMVGTPEFATAAARDAAITSPLQGMTAKRADASYTEGYYTSADPDGWYPVLGDLPRVRSRRKAAQTLNNTWQLLNAVWGTPDPLDLLGFSYSAGAFTCLVPGLYSVEAFVQGANSNTALGLQVLLNSTSVDTAATIAAFNSTSSTAALTGAARNDLVKLAANDVLRVYCLGGSSQGVGSLAENAKLNVAYRGPSA